MSRIEYKYIITEFEYEKKPIGGIFWQLYLDRKYQFIQYKHYDIGASIITFIITSKITTMICIWSKICFTVSSFP